MAKTNKHTSEQTVIGTYRIILPRGKMKKRKRKTLKTKKKKKKETNPYCTFGCWKTLPHS